MEAGEPVAVQSPQPTENLPQTVDSQKRESKDSTAAPIETPKMTAEEAGKNVQRLKATLLRQLKVVLMAGECHAQLERQKEVDAVVERIVCVVRESKAVTAADIINQAETFIKEKDYIQALIAIQCVCKLATAEKLPYEALFDLGEWMPKVDDLYSEASDKKYASLKAFCVLNVNFMDQIAEQLSGIDEAFDDLRVKVKVRCLGNKADCLGALGRDDEALELYGQCVDAMREQFGEDASANRYFGEFLSNIANLYIGKKQFVMAQSYFEESLAARVMAQDFPSEEEKQSVIASINRVLSQLEQLAAQQQAQSSLASNKDKGAGKSLDASQLD